jgi:hypothetical protein
MASGHPAVCSVRSQHGQGKARDDNRQNMEDRRPAIVGVIVAFQVLSWLALAVRLYARRFTVKLVGWDDSTFKLKSLALFLPQRS